MEQAIIKGRTWGELPGPQLRIDDEEERLGVSLTDDTGELREDEIFLDVDQAGQAMEAIGGWLTEGLEEGRGATVLGFVGLNNVGEVCFFEHSLADGVSIRQPQGLRNAVDAARRRRVTAYHLHVLDPKDAKDGG